MRVALLSCLALAVALALGRSALAQPPSAYPDYVPPKPDWVSKPTANDFARLYPTQSAEKKVQGVATIQCVFNSEGTLDGCHVLDEDPVGGGFGEASLAIVALFHAKRLQLDGAPIVGSVFRTRIRWNLVTRR